MLVRSSVRASLLVLLAAAPTSQESQAVFDAPVVLKGNYTVPYMELLDFDGDGAWDVTGVALRPSGTSGAYRWLAIDRGDGGGTFPRRWRKQIADSSPEGRDPADVAVGRIGLDDGADEVVHAYGRVVEIWSDVAGTPTNVATYGAPASVRQAITGDFDGDGLGDFALLTVEGLYAYLHRAGGAPRVVPVELPPGKWLHLERGALTRAGVHDLVAVGESALALVTVPALLAGGRTPRLGSVEPRLLSHGLPAPDPAVADVDGDGDEDLVLFSKTTLGGVYRVLRQGPGGPLRLEAARLGGPATGLADVDQDGDPDGICCGGGTSPPSNVVVSQFEICLNDGTGAFGNAFTLQGLGATQIAGAEDLDGDGDVELVAGRAVYYGRGPLVPRTDWVPQEPAPAQQSLVDVDGDGDVDLFRGLDGAHLNAGDGSVTDRPLRIRGTAPGAYYLGPGIPGDFDGDGRPDLLVEAWLDAETDDGLHLLLNRGLSTSTLELEDLGQVLRPSPPVSAKIELRPEHSIVQDVDGDGRLDVVLRSAQEWPADHHSTVLFNDGVGAWSAGPALPDELVEAVADVDADGLQDLVTRWGSPGSRVPRIGFRHGQPGGRTFEDFGVVPTLSYSYLTDVRDDVLVGSFTTAAIPEIVFVNEGREGPLVTMESGGTWAYSWTNTWIQPWWSGFPSLRQIFPYITGDPRRLLRGDLSGDWRPDMVFYPAPDAPNAAAVSLHHPLPGFWFDVRVQLVQPTALADLDGDGDDESIGRRVHEGRFFEGPIAGARREFGLGTPGSGDCVPVLGATGPFRPNKTVELRIHGGVGGAQVQLVVSRGLEVRPNYPVPGITSYPSEDDPYWQVITRTLSGTPGEPGAGAATIPFTIPASFQGVTEYFQAFVTDPGAPNGMCSTNALQLDFGGAP